MLQKKKKQTVKKLMKKIHTQKDQVLKKNQKLKKQVLMIRH